MKKITEITVLEKKRLQKNVCAVGRNRATWKIDIMKNCIETEKRHECSNIGESKTTRIMMAIVRHATFISGLRKFQADGFLFD